MLTNARRKILRLITSAIAGELREILKKWWISD
jgi:hypothetical protein